jgi:hypothetical protein
MILRLVEIANTKHLIFIAHIAPQKTRMERLFYRGMRGLSQAQDRVVLVNILSHHPSRAAKSSPRSDA